MPMTTPIEEVLHGVAVEDPYRWLENRSLQETDAWIRRQQKQCSSYFDASPEMQVLERLVQQYLDVEVVDQPVRIADRYFYRKRERKQEQTSIFVRAAETNIERLLIDPSSDGPFTSVAIYCISPEGNYLAYELKRGGEDRKEIRFVDVDSALVLPDRISSGYGRGLAFTGRGYFYSQETEATVDEHKVCYHPFGSTRPDRVVFRVPCSPGGRLILIGNSYHLGSFWTRQRGSEMIANFSIARLREDLEWVEVFREKLLPYNPILYQDRILVLTETASKSSHLIELSSDGRELRVVVPEKAVPIRQVVASGDRIFVSYLERNGTTVDAWLLDGEETAASIEVPMGGTIQILPSLGPNSDSFFYSYESFDVPPCIYEYSARANRTMLWHRRGPTIRKSECRIQEMSITSKDGTQVPLTLVSSNHKPGSTPGPVIVTSYGGFGVTMTPQFSVFVTILMELGFSFVMPHIRGGGEFGKEWHEAGRARNRQAGFDDFIAAAEWLCQQQVTSPRQLAIFGGSNSGLLVGAVMTQRPDLFGAVLCIAPLLDMVRYESFDQAAKWREEYGTIGDPDDFRALYAYSPYHHITEGVNYPATMFVTGDKDDRCNPAHVRKMAARLQGRAAQTSPVIVDYSEERGHSPVLPLSVRIPALARRIAFVCRQLQISISQGGFDETSRP
jgi:prolyl oligopeptidase